MIETIFNLAEKENIKIKELSGKGLSLPLLYKLKKKDTPFKPEKHVPLFLNAFNKAYENKNLSKRIKKEDLYLTSIQELENLVNESLTNKNFYNEEQIKSIKEFELKYEVHSLKYRYLIGKYYMKKGDLKKSLNIFQNLLNNFDCYKFLYSILIETIRLEEIEKTYDIFLKYQFTIDKAPIDIKSLIYYNTAVNLLRCNKYHKAMILFNKVINLPIKTKQFYKSWNNYGICLRYQKKYEKAIEAFKNSVSDFLNYKELETCYINIISCAKASDNEILMKVTLKKLENILLSFKDKVIYQTYQCIGINYLYLKEEKKAIKAFEKDVFQKYNYNSSSFSKEKYFNSIEHLVKLYKLNTLKQQKLINLILKTPINILDKTTILNILKYYFNNSMEYEGRFLIKHLQI